MILMGLVSPTVSEKLIWILAVLSCLARTGVFSLTPEKEEEELAKMKQQWEECCRSNKTLCVKGSCYSMEWRAAAWASVRNRCRGRYSDWPFAVDIMKIQEEEDIETLWKLLSMVNAYPNANTDLPITVWTGGTRCPRQGPSGIIVSTKWASNQPFPSWLEEKVNGTAADNSSDWDEGCKFMVITPKANGTAVFSFEAENAKYAAVCEFLFSGKDKWTSSIPNATVSTMPSSCTDNLEDNSTTCNSETDSTTVEQIDSTLLTTKTTSNITTDNENGTTTLLTIKTTLNITTDNENGTTTLLTTTSVLTTGKNSTIENKDKFRTTDVSRENGSKTNSSPKDKETTEPSVSTADSETGGETTSSHSESTAISPNRITTRTSIYSSSVQTTTVTESESRTTGDVSSPGCEERFVSGILWPETPAGETANQSCPEGMKGFAQWKCDEKTKRFSPEKPSIHRCRHEWIDKLEDEIHADGDAVEISSKLADKTRENELSHGDIAAVVQLAENLMELFAKQKYEKETNKEILQVPNMTYDFTKSFVATYSNVLRIDHKDAWSDLPRGHQRQAASKILRHTETVGQVLSCIKMTDDNVQYTVLEDNINLQTFMFNSSEERRSPYVFPKPGLGVLPTGRIELPANLTLNLWPNSCEIAKTAVGIVYKNVGQFLKEESAEEICSNVSSSVLGFTLGNSSTESVKLPTGFNVTVLLKHSVPLNKKSAAYKTPRCVFWNFSRGSYGDWDDSGCSVVYSNFSYTRCSCNHLTNFAILMDVNNNIGRDDPILELMTFICCGTSAVTLILTIICLISIRSIRCRRSTITCNLCVCLLLMNVIIVFGVDRTQNEILCSVIAGFLQYSLLASFCWMLLEAYQLYQMVVLVFSSSKRIRMVYFYFFGYGAPLLIVGVSAGVRHEGYGGPDFCWLSNENGLMWSFVGPACVIIMVNLVVFVMTIRSASSVKIKKEQKMAEKAKSWVKGSLSILCLLGLTWCIGLLYMAKGFYATSYIFTILNGLQGVFIFVFHVLLNDKTGSIFRRMFKAKIVRQTTKSTVLNGTSSSGHRRAQFYTGSINLNSQTRGSCSSLNLQNTRTNSVSSNGVPSRIIPVVSHSPNSSEGPNCLSRVNTVTKSVSVDGMRKKSSSYGFSKDIPYSRTRSGVLRQVQRAQNGK